MLDKFTSKGRRDLSIIGIGLATALGAYIVVDSFNDKYELPPKEEKKVEITEEKKTEVIQVAKRTTIEICKDLFSNPQKEGLNDEIKALFGKELSIEQAKYECLKLGFDPKKEPTKDETKVVDKAHTGVPPVPLKTENTETSLWGEYVAHLNGIKNYKATQSQTQTLAPVKQTGTFNWRDKLAKNNVSLSPEFERKVKEVAARIGIPNYEYLMSVMTFETAGTMSPSIRNYKSSATGLIQFLESTAKNLGTTTEKLARMNQIEQMDLVEKYLMPFQGKLKTLADVYAAVFRPILIGKDSFLVVAEKGTQIYNANSGLDSNGDGYLVWGEIMAHLGESEVNQVQTKVGGLEHKMTQQPSRDGTKAFMDMFDKHLKNLEQKTPTYTQQQPTVQPKTVPIPFAPQKETPADIPKTTYQTSQVVTPIKADLPENITKYEPATTGPIQLLPLNMQQGPSLSFEKPENKPSFARIAEIRTIARNNANFTSCTAKLNGAMKIITEDHLRPIDEDFSVGKIVTAYNVLKCNKS